MIVCWFELSPIRLMSALRRLFRVACIVTASLAVPVHAATFMSYAVADTSMFQNHPDYNLGGTTLVAGTNQQASYSRALFRFDLSAIPAGSIITDVQVSLSVTRRPDPDQHGGPVSSDFSLYRVLVDWSEGSGGAVTGSPASIGDTTWNERHYGVPGTEWSSPGGHIGTDFASLPSATTAVGDVGDYLWGSSPELVSDVQAWLDNPAANFGFALISESEGLAGTARRFASREQPGGITPAPQLTVTYVAAPEPGRMLLLLAGIAAGLFRRQRFSAR